MPFLYTHPRGRVVRLLGVAAALAIGAAPPAAVPQAKSKAPAKQQIADPLVIDGAGYQQVLAKERGKVVLVDFWATWCESCRDEYPMINELAKEYGPQGLVVIGVSLDDDGEITLVRRFLNRIKPVFANYRKRPGKEEEFINSVDRKWSGAIPADFFYDREGRQAKSFIGEHKRAEFESAIQTLLGGTSKTGGGASAAAHSSTNSR